MTSAELNLLDKPEVNTKSLLKDLKGKQYLGAHEAIYWFTVEHPAPEGRIVTHIDFEHSCVRAEIYVGDVLVATGHSIGDGSKSLEKLETGAVRRALANAGYGTIAALAESDDEDAARTQARAAMVSKKLDDDGVDVREKLGSGGKGKQRKVDTSKGAPTPFDGEHVDRYANLFAAIDETGHYRVKDVSERDVPGTVHVVLTKAVNDTPKFAEWLKEKFGKDKIINVGSSWFDLKWSASPTPGGEG